MGKPPLIVLVVQARDGRPAVELPLADLAVVEAVGTVDEAYAWLSSFVADVVIIDFELAQTASGVDLLSTLGRRPDRGTTRVVIARGDINLRTLNAFPADVVFTQPLDLDELHGLIARLHTPALPTPASRSGRESHTEDVAERAMKLGRESRALLTSLIAKATRSGLRAW